MPYFAPYIYSPVNALDDAVMNARVRDPLDALSPSAGTFQTVGATTAVLYSETLQINTCLCIRGHVIGMRDDYSAGLLARFEAVFRRDAGNVVLAGQTVDLTNDTASALAVTVAIFTPTQLGYIYATGVASQTWNWRVVCMANLL